MKAVIQRVLESSVSVDGRVVGSSGKGYMILVGVAKGDTEKHADLLARKTASLRVFEDENGKKKRNIDESNSISNQKQILSDYAKKHGYKIVY